MKAIKSAVALASALVAISSPLAADQVSTLDDIHYWVGEGTNRCGVAVDWAGDSLAWGYRWNGTCTNLAEVLVRIGREDPRLKIEVQGMTSDFVDFYFFGYDVNDNHPQWDTENCAASDPEAMAFREDSVYYSAWWVLYGPMNGNSFPVTAQTSSWSAANQITPQNNDWFVFSYGCPDYDASWNEVPAMLTLPEAAESPYGYEVVEYMTAEGNSLYNDPENVIGHPSAYMDDPSVYWGGQNFGGVINPANPAWGTGRLFTLSSYGEDECDVGDDEGPGYVTIKFDHDVIDDPMNPFGLDFIVFGNALAVGSDNSYYNPGTDPAKFFFNGEGSAEAAKVEVSQDGKTWYSSNEWKMSDDFAPTLGHLYEPQNYDPCLFAANKFWGRTAQATRPVDPRIGFDNFANLSLAQVCQYYNGSAGGTGYDLSVLDLPANKDGRKWIRYVRVSGVYQMGEEGDFGYSEPEVDAIADVAPVSAYEKWVEANYTDWTTAWKPEVTGPDAVAANGKANALNFFLGIDANETSGEFDFKIRSFVPGENFHLISVITRNKLSDGCGIVVKKAESVNAKAREWKTEVPVVESSVPAEGGNGFVTVFKFAADEGKFFKLAIDLK